MLLQEKPQKRVCDKMRLKYDLPITQHKKDLFTKASQQQTVTMALQGKLGGMGGQPPAADMGGGVPPQNVGWGRV